jgi:hypothetical protein
VLVAITVAPDLSWPSDQLGKPCGCGAGADPDRQSTENAPGIERSDASRKKKYDGADDGDRHRDHGRPAAANLVGQSSKQQ